MIIGPQGETFSLCFHWPEVDSHISFSRVCRLLMELGYQRIPECIVTQDHDFARTGGSIVADNNQFNCMLDNRSVAEAGFEILVKQQESPSIDTVSFMPMSNVGRENNNNSGVQIVSDGWYFSLPIFSTLSFKVGEYYSNLFKLICVKLLPDYASILHEDFLFCVADMKFRSDSACQFSDFYLSNNIIEHVSLNKFRNLVLEAYTEDTATGCYVSTRKWFNPLKQQLNKDRKKLIDFAVRKLVCDHYLGNTQLGKT